MGRLLKSFMVMAIAAAIAAAGQAAVVIDEDGLGFVGKGDIQSVYGWNNAQLQAHAHLLEFRFVASSEATWQCEEWQDHQVHGLRLLGVLEYEITSVASNVAYDARKNKQGQITGFNLNGFSDTSTEQVGNDLAAGECPPPQNSGNNPKHFVLVEGSLQASVVEEGALEVSIDGIAWFAIELPVNELEE
jgi:hypothetical protein